MQGKQLAKEDQFPGHGRYYRVAANECKPVDESGKKKGTFGV